MGASWLWFGVARHLFGYPAYAAISTQADTVPFLMLGTHNHENRFPLPYSHRIPNDDDSEPDSSHVKS